MSAASNVVPLRAPKPDEEVRAEPVDAILTAKAGYIRVTGHSAHLSTGQRLVAGAAGIEAAGHPARTTVHPTDDPPTTRTSPEVEPAPVADPPDKADIQPMTDPISRNEVSARLEAVEARLDSKIAQVGADVQTIGAKMDMMVGHMAEFRQEVRADVRSVKGHVIAASGIVLAAMVGMAALLLAAQGNNSSWFQSGVALGERAAAIKADDAATSSRPAPPTAAPTLPAQPVPALPQQ